VFCNKEKKMENFGYLYSIAVAAGGIVGYVKKGKKLYCIAPR